MTFVLKNLLYTGAMKKNRQDKSPTESGARLAAMRKAAGFSQTQLATMIDVPQRTISFYETEAEAIPSILVADFAHALGVSVEEILGISTPKSKPGPKSKLERQLESVRRLPRKEQAFVSKFLDNVLSQAANKGQ